MRKIMNKKGEMSMGILVMIFVGVIFSFAMIPIIADTVGGMVNKQLGVNSSISVVTAYESEFEVNETLNFTIFTQSVWKQVDCPLTSVALRNGAGTALVEDADYTLYANQGVFSLLNTSLTEPQTALNLTYADYTFCLDGYNTGAGSRGMLNLLVIFVALMVLAFVLEKSDFNFGGMFG